MTEAVDLVGLLAGEDIRKVPDAEPHLGPERRRQELACRLRGVDRGRRVEAIVAIAAMLGRIFPEMAKQDRAPAQRRFDQRRQRVQPLALGGPAVGLDLLLDPLAGPREILRRPQ